MYPCPPFQTSKYATNVESDGAIFAAAAATAAAANVRLSILGICWTQRDLAYVAHGTHLFTAGAFCRTDSSSLPIRCSLSYIQGLTYILAKVRICDEATKL